MRGMKARTSRTRSPSTKAELHLRGRRLRRPIRSSRGKPFPASDHEMRTTIRLLEPARVVIDGKTNKIAVFKAGDDPEGVMFAAHREGVCVERGRRQRHVAKVRSATRTAASLHPGPQPIIRAPRQGLWQRNATPTTTAETRTAALCRRDPSATHRRRSGERTRWPSTRLASYT